MPDLAIADITDDDVEAVVALWQRCGLTRPWNDPYRDIAFARASACSAVLTGKIDGALVAGVMVGHDGHRGAIYYLAVDPDARGAGHGRAMLQAAEGWLVMRGIWKTNLMVREGNEAVLGFYAAMGYQPGGVVSLGKWIGATTN